MKKHKLSVLPLAVFAALSAPFSHASITFDQTDKGYSFILNVDEYEKNYCTTVDSHGLHVNECKNYGYFEESSKQILVWENAKLRPARDTTSASQTRPTCLTNHGIGKRVSFLPCEEWDIDQNIVPVLDEAIKGGYTYNFKFSADICLTYNQYGAYPYLYTDNCTANNKYQQFSPKNIQELIEIEFVNNSSKKQSAAVLVKKGDDTLINAFAENISNGAKKSVTVTDFNAYGYVTDEEIYSPDHFFPSVNINNENLRSGDKYSVNISRNATLQTEKTAFHTPVLIDSHTYKSMLVSVSQLFVSIFVGSDNIFSIYYSEDLVRTYKKSLYEGTSQLHYSTRYIYNRDSRSFKVIQLADPNTSIRLQIDIERASDGEYLVPQVSPPQTPTTQKLDVSKIYRGNQGLDNSCPGGRMLTVAELQTDKSWCTKEILKGDYAIYKVDGGNNTIWQMMGRGYDCELKPGGITGSFSQCTTQPEIEDSILFAIKHDGRSVNAGPYHSSLHKGDWTPGFIFRDQSANELKLYVLLTGDEAKNTAFINRNHWAPLNVRQWRSNDRGIEGEIFQYKNTYIKDNYIELWRLKNSGAYGYLPTNRTSNQTWQYLGMLEVQS